MFFSSNASPQPQEDTSKKAEEVKPAEATTASPATPESSRDVKTKGPIIRDSIKMVTNQLLDKEANTSADTPILSDTRIPPKLKNQLANKQKIKTRNEDGDESMETAHAGVAVPMTMEELETENKISESSTSNEGISTWILLSNPSNVTTSTEPTKVEENQKKQKPAVSKNKTKRPQTNKINPVKRPIIGSTNKADLIASGSAINENVYNKIKDTVLSNVQKNKNNPTPRTTTTVITTTTTTTTTEAPTTKKEATKAPAPIVIPVKIASKPAKKKKNKHKTTTTEAPAIQESALLPMEPKEQEIELEVSTPPTTTKKPKRNSTRKKNKTKKRKTSKPKPDSETAVSEIKTSNKTKSGKPSKKPTVPSGPISSQIYNYLSREVMGSVGVGVIGLASLVGLASYFLYPFSTPVRRTFEVDKKDDIYRNNAEEYANEGNGQAEEEMLGTVLAGMPAHSKQKLNPYAGQTHVSQTHVSVSRYPVKKEQDLRYRHVATSYEHNNNVHYPQQKTGIAHAAVYAKPINYGPQQYDTRNVYTTESKYVYDKAPSAYTPYPAVEPIYAAPQTGPSAVAYGSVSDPSSVVYGVKPSAETDFRPVYPFEGKIFSETTSNPITYPPTSMYLGSNNESEEPQDAQYEEESANTSSDSVDNKFVVGNVPKELVESATPAVVPEHGPRNIRKRRNANYRKRELVSIEEMLKEANKDVFISNEIDETPGLLISNLVAATDSAPIKSEATTTPETKEVFTVYAMPVNPSEDEKSITNKTPAQEVLIESVSTVPIDKTTETDSANELDVTTKGFQVYEVFTNSPVENTDQKSQTFKEDSSKLETTTQFKNMMTETTTEYKSETTSTMPPSPSPISETKLPPTKYPRPTLHPEVITYPPLNQEGGFFSFLKRLVEFKYRLGLSILQTTSENLNRYLRSMENTAQKLAKASN